MELVKAWLRLQERIDAFVTCGVWRQRTFSALGFAVSMGNPLFMLRLERFLSMPQELLLHAAIEGIGCWFWQRYANSLFLPPELRTKLNRTGVAMLCLWFVLAIYAPILGTPLGYVLVPTGVLCRLVGKLTQGRELGRRQEAPHIPASPFELGPGLLLYPMTETEFNQLARREAAEN